MEGVEPYDWDIIIGDHGHLVIVNAESLNTFRSSVDQSQSVCLASGEFEFRNSSIVCARRFISGSDSRAVEIHLAVDEIVVRGRAGV